jgi:hypothetical protein
MELEFEKYRGYFFGNLSRAVASIEQRHFQTEKLRSKHNKLAENDNLQTARRQKQQELRDQTMRVIEERARQIETQRDKDLRAERAKLKELEADRKARRLEADIRQRERRRQQQSVRDSQEEAALAELERRHASDRARRLQAAEAQQETDALYAERAKALYRQTHPEARLDSDEFSQAKLEWALREQWEAVREGRFAQDRAAVQQAHSRWQQYHQQHNRSSPSAARRRMFAPGPLSPTRSMIPPPPTTFSPRELRLEAQFRSDALRAAVEAAETQRLLSVARHGVSLS